MLTKDNAICIRATDFSETSQILTLFTRDAGKISAIAKGSKRAKSAFDGHVEVFSHGSIVYSDSKRERLATLTEFEQKPGFTNLPADLFALNCCLFATELVNLLTDDYDPHPRLFDAFLKFLQNTNEKQKPLPLLILFQLTLLREIGLMPILNACANCKTQYERRAASDEMYFSSSANGFICADCEASFPDKIKLTKTAADCLADTKLLAEAQEKPLNEVEKTLIHHFTEILHRQPKMAKYILKN
jgi:DNA repair protein RecO (recombination protein O)